MAGAKRSVLQLPFRFEVRTYRLCRRVLMFHHFPDELGIGRLPGPIDRVRISSRSRSARSSRGSIQSGYKRQPDGRYLKSSMPPLDLAYTPSPLEDADYRGDPVRDVDPCSVANLPEGIDGTNYRWVDLDGEGISGVLSEQAGAGSTSPTWAAAISARPRLVARRPSARCA